MIIEYAKQMRLCHIMGRRGGGKTSLSIAMALRIVADGNADKIVSNTPLKIGELVDQVDAQGTHEIEDAVVILDEAWKELGKRSKVRGRDAWLAYLRHYNQYLLMPSALDLCPEASVFGIERNRSLTPFGIPLWIYKYSRDATGLKGHKKSYDIGTYYWWHPHRVFSYYDHLYNPRETYYVYHFGS